MEFGNIYHPQAYCLLLPVPFQNFSRVHTVGSAESIDFAITGLNAEVVGKGHYAAASVAAHHSPAPIGVVVIHFEIAVVSGTQDHKSVGAVTGAEPYHIKLGKGFSAVKNHKGVAGTGVEAEFHRMSEARILMPPSIFSSSMKE